MKYIQDNELVTLYRTAHITKLKQDGYISNFEKKHLEKIISNRVEVIQNYIMYFGQYLRSYYTLASKWRKYRLKRILGKYRLFEIMSIDENKTEAEFIKISEVFKLYRKLNLKKDFEKYFVGKTNLSYTVFNQHPIEAMIFKKAKKLKTVEDVISYLNHGNKLSDHRTFRLKVAQFVHCIMSEYIVLNNLMFASGYKVECINTTDTWLNDLVKK